MSRKLLLIGVILSLFWLVAPIVTTKIVKADTEANAVFSEAINIQKNVAKKLSFGRALSCNLNDSSLVSLDNELIIPTQINTIEDRQEITSQALREKRERERKVVKVRNFLSRWSGPAKYYAEDFISAAEQYGIDYRILPAIAVVESAACKKTFRPYNCFGLMTKTQYKSYTESIFAAGKTIARYYAKGLKTPELIGPGYAGGSTSWGAKVRGLMNQI